jgi:hypothetical protein
VLEQLADHIEGRAPGMVIGSAELRECLAEALRSVEAEASRHLPSAKAQSLIALLRAIDDLTNQLREKIAAACPIPR